MTRIIDDLDAIKKAIAEDTLKLQLGEAPARETAYMWLEISRQLIAREEEANELLDELRELLAEYRDIGDSAGGIGGTLHQRVDTALGRI